MNLRRVKLAGGEIKQNADEFILGVAQPLGAAPAVTIFEQQFLGPRAGLHQRRLETPRHGLAQLALAAGIAFGQRVQIGDDRRAVEKFARVAGGAVNFEHWATVLTEVPAGVIVRRGLRRG